MGKAYKLGCIFLASGHSKRFGSNKLLSDCGGRTMIDVVLGNFPCEFFHEIVVVTRYPAVAVTAAGYGFIIAENEDDTDDMAKTIRLGLEHLNPNLDGCMFSVCDQPMLRAESIQRMAETFQANPNSIVALGYHGKRGNPVIFPKDLFGELAGLSPNQSGSAVIAAHEERLVIVEASNRHELVDVDYRN